MEKELYIRRHRDYAVFSKIFAGPVDSDTKQVIINLFNNLIIFARHMQDESLKNSLEFVIDFLQKNNEEELNRIYTSLFVSGGYGKILCPVESFYLDNTGQIMGEKRDAVFEIYVKNKLSLVKTFKEQEDHIAAELSYISIKNKEILEDNYIQQLLDNNINEQYIFIKNHLLPLIHYFILDLKKYDQSMLYFETACIIKKYLEYDFIKSYG